VVAVGRYSLTWTGRVIRAIASLPRAQHLDLRITGLSEVTLRT
jgi:hypothetical protein